MTTAIMQTVLLTGATGFLGSQVMRALLRGGYAVVGLKRSWSGMSRILAIQHKVELINLDEEPLARVFERRPIHAVIHTATCYGRKGEEVRDIVRSNLLFPLELADFSAKAGVKAFLNTDTFFDEKTELPGNMQYYVLSKKHFLDYAQRLSGDSGMQLVNLRLEHLYGPGDDQSKFMPTILRALLRGDTHLDLTEGRQRRDFIYVGDAAAAYLAVLRGLDRVPVPFATLELGSGVAIQLADVVKLASRLCESATELRFGTLPYRANEIMHSQADIAPLRGLGWRPATDIERGLRQTILHERAALANVAAQPVL